MVLRTSFILVLAAISGSNLAFSQEISKQTNIETSVSLRFRGNHSAFGTANGEGVRIEIGKTKGRNHYLGASIGPILSNLSFNDPNYEMRGGSFFDFGVGFFQYYEAPTAFTTEKLTPHFGIGYLVGFWKEYYQFKWIGEDYLNSNAADVEYEGIYFGGPRLRLSLGRRPLSLFLKGDLMLGTKKRSITFVNQFDPKPISEDWEFSIVPEVDAGFCFSIVPDKVSPEEEYLSDEEIESTGRAKRNTVMVELLGQGWIGSLEYERFLYKELFARVGASAWGGHVSLGLLRGVRHHFEMGAGAFINYEGLELNYGNLILGYRYQKPRGGFVARVAFTPLIAMLDELPLFPWIGASFGYAF